MVVVQVAVCTFLLLVVMHHTQDLLRSPNVTYGFDADSVIGIETTSSQDAIALLSEFQKEPWVAAVSVAQTIPSAMGWTSLPRGNAPALRVSSNVVSDDYFSALRLPIVKGRAFTQAEVHTAAPVAIVSETLATYLWPGLVAVGQSIATHNTQRGDVLKVVGICGDMLGGIDRLSDRRTLYLPGLDHNSRFLLLRGWVTGAGSKGQVDRFLLRSSVAPRGTISFRLLDRLGEGPFTQLLSWVLDTMTTVAIALTAIGLYALLRYSLHLKRKEIAIRMALGADPKRVACGVLLESCTICLAGFGIAVMVLSTVFVLGGFPVRVSDAIAVALSGIAIMMMGVVSAAIPAWKAANSHVVAVLKED